MPTGIYKRTKETLDQLKEKGFKKGYIPWDKGKERPPFSEEWKRNMSEARRKEWKEGNRKPPNEETKRKLSLSHLGKLSGNKGKKASEETKRKLRESHIGITAKEKNPNWKGGITDERHSFCSSEEWAKVIPIIWARYKKTCQKCNKKYKQGDQFHIHHIVGFINKKLRTEPNNLVLLCRKCHYWVHSKNNKNKEFLN